MRKVAKSVPTLMYVMVHLVYSQRGIRSPLPVLALSCKIQSSIVDQFFVKNTTKQPDKEAGKNSQRHETTIFSVGCDNGRTKSLRYKRRRRRNSFVYEGKKWLFVGVSTLYNEISRSFMRRRRDLYTMRFRKRAFLTLFSFHVFINRY